MSTRRLIDFEVTSDEGAERVNEALVGVFEALAGQRPDGVRLAYWRVTGGRRFHALIELVDEGPNPLMDIPASRALPGLIGSCVDGGYPRPVTVELVGSYGFDV
ncbi:hypothetical protein [Pseudofrankia inefficax]|uniref:Antibiotic biosynthesis monooxygenase n=1 Tax=Pseudofrankia inefficax (strain DSM 45817 / CECT 9037 / DDB 130130 / EuI1c) TaxID=298654 RepID=E3IUL0_PSEI1|nr:hypothetical protein [Pseudofrankia inefficax]ADP83695.1 hypothetical protein FraEuI1c_5711 [Pseudofrankia inefficax]